MDAQVGIGDPPPMEPVPDDGETEDTSYLDETEDEHLPVDESDTPDDDEE